MGLKSLGANRIGIDRNDLDGTRYGPGMDLDWIWTGA